MSFDQIPKQQIDIGQIGNPSTGDILYDGGDKINGNMDAIYNSFGDRRLFNQGIAEGNQTIHATGYYQKVEQIDFRTPVPMGSMFDVDATAGSVSPILEPGKKGEGVIFVNFNGSISVNRPLVIQASGGGSFVGVQGALQITMPYSRVECWCINDTGGVPIWNYKVSSLFGTAQTPIERTIALNATPTSLQLCHLSEYQAMKILLTSSNALSTKMRASEVNLLIDSVNKKVHATEYAVLQPGYIEDQPELFTFEFSIDVQGYVSLSASSTYPNVRLAVKSIATQKIGAA